MKTISLLFLCLSACITLTARDRYDRWIDEEVRWIASAREIAEFKSLDTEDSREAFIADFWRRRDPNPETQANAYKAEFYLRWEYVNKHFNEASPGWKTDRGRVYLLHGPPDSIENVSGHRLREQDAIIWTYFQMPTAKYAKGRMLLVFQPNMGMTQQDVTLGESSTARRKGAEIFGRQGVNQGDLVRHAARYRLVSAGPPATLNAQGLDVPGAGIGEMARYLEDVMRPPGELLDESAKEAERQQASRRQLREQVRSSVSYESLPVAMACREFYGGDSSTITVTWQIARQAVQFNTQSGSHHAQLDLVAEIYSESGVLVDEFFKAIEIFESPGKKDQESRELYYVNEFQVKPGLYRVRSIVKDTASGRLGTTDQQIESLGLDGDKVTLSDLVLSRHLVEADESGLGRQLITDQWKVIPKPDGRFSPNDSLVLFFKVYNSGSSEAEEPQLVVNYDFFKENQLVKTSGPRKISEYTDPSRKTISYSSIVDLSDFPSGQYSLQVTAIDYRTQKYALRRVQFSIE